MMLDELLLNTALKVAKKKKKIVSFVLDGKDYRDSLKSSLL